MSLHESSRVKYDLHIVYGMLGQSVDQVQGSPMWYAYSSKTIQNAIKDSPISPKYHWQDAHLKAHAR